MGTIPIVFNAKQSQTIADGYGNPTNDMAKAIELALEALPNYVIDAVSVNVTSLLMEDTNFNSETVSISIAFIGASVQGPQNLLMVESAKCGRRGKCDYDTGVCECFEGYTGLQCQIQTSL